MRSITMKMAFEAMMLNEMIQREFRVKEKDGDQNLDKYPN